MEQYINQLPPWLQPHIHFAVANIKENPVHFAVEIFLIIFISYILLVKRSYDPAKRYVQKLKKKLALCVLHFRLGRRRILSE